MKKKMIYALTALTISAAMMVGCGSSAEQENSGETQEEESAEETTEEKEDTELANPWTQSDEEGVAEATGFEMTAPEEAEDVAYSYMEDGKMAQMVYTENGTQWTYRIQEADELTDISGLAIQWKSESDGSVSGREAKCYTYTDLNNDTEDDIMLVNWYDAVTGVTYSLSAVATDLNGLDIEVYAEQLYTPLQGDATDDPEGDRLSELNDYFLGEHVKSEDESSLTITDNGDDTFEIAISITRLCSLENGVGTFEDHKMTFTIEDPNGDEMSGMIYRDSDNSLTVKITDSTWNYLPNDEVIEGFGK